ncbi:ATP-binding protein [Bradyrhizobium sp. LVM 105]|uniref:ATP-binding protein n=1 Tax=Bradyrhizobium sp. LVM 105 TaxID=2341115 RepID=UPI000F8152C9|nr:ATP-binding protein [Bradyrhizobium sp. LVM 105]RTE93074.1 ATP-binding protein [Bradyrhizobium sp. LVM 105]
MSPTERIPFDVDAALLRELGERLVGRADIAVAELVKNSYDADASLVSIEIGRDEIVVEDNGHGMSDVEFRTFWMRIGSPHKFQQRHSKKKRRPLTGSKGVGRLAVQFLGSSVEVTTTSAEPRSVELKATVDWTQAETKKDLTKVVAVLETSAAPGRYCDGSRHGTRITIKRLAHDWTDPERARSLASEIWQLRSPEPASARRTDETFDIQLSSVIPKAQEEFQKQLLAPLDIWHAILQGELTPPRKGGDQGELQVNLRFREQSRPQQHTFSVPRCFLRNLRFEIRVYSLFGRQPAAIAVSNAREYITQHGGIKIYDSGFRLPYYGLEHDWLDIEVDHSHRKSESQLLPSNLQVPGGLSNVPTQTRLLGYVYVNTGQEAATAAPGEDYLQIQVTRDRLVDNAAYQNLKSCVRTAIDWYAMRETLRRLQEVEEEVAIRPRREEQVRSVAQILARHAPELPKRQADEIKREIEAVVDHQAATQELLGQNLNLLGALATAGMFALAFEHEIARQLTALEVLSGRIRSSSKMSAELSDELDRWIRRVRQTRSIFSSLSDEESRRKRQRFNAKSAVEQFVAQAEPFLGGIEVNFEAIDDELKLPAGTFADWSAVFQNALANAANAMIDKRVRKIGISSEQSGGRAFILIQDTGSGVDLQDSEKLFEPFARKTVISQERRSLSIGGTGLGLTIVRMISKNLGFDVSFVKPGRAFATCLKIAWQENTR